LKDSKLILAPESALIVSNQRIMIQARNTALVFSLVLLDQFSKYIIRTSGGFYICNPNISFGLKVPEFLFWLFWIIIILFLLVLIYKKYLIYNTLHIMLILSGAISNVIDRLFFGCVIDFINLRIWPVFNLADIYITLGATILIVKYTTRNTK